MACYRPLYGWQGLAGGPVFFGAERPDTRYVEIPCGYCVGCRLRRSRSWALRCMHEASMYDANSFVTLTYDDKHYHPSLNYSDFQKFLKRLRKRTRLCRYFMCGEYGSENFRPHFHALLFGVSFPNLQSVGSDLYRSSVLESLWPFGFSSIGSVTYESAGYVARYSLKKVFGPAARDHYKRVHLHTGEIVDVVPEFCHMSKGRHGTGGLGYSWFQKFWREVYVPRDGCVRPGGRTIPPPRYYDKLLDSMDSDLRDFRSGTRAMDARLRADDSTSERLLVREMVTLASLRQLKRTL